MSCPGEPWAPPAPARQATLQAVTMPAPGAQPSSPASRAALQSSAATKGQWRRWMAFTNPEPLSPVNAILILFLFSLGAGINISADSLKNGAKLAGPPAAPRFVQYSCPRACLDAGHGCISARGATPCASADQPASARLCHPVLRTGQQKVDQEIWRLSLDLPGFPVQPHHVGDWMRCASTHRAAA